MPLRPLSGNRQRPLFILYYEQSLTFPETPEKRQFDKKGGEGIF